MENQETYFKGIVPPPILFFTLVLIGFIAKWLLPFNLIFHSWPTRVIIGTALFIISGLIAINALIIMKKKQDDY